MLVDRFLEHLAYEKRSSVLTVKAYGQDLNQFSAFLKEAVGLDHPQLANDKAVRAWMMRLLENGTGPRSVNRKLSALRAFYKFARTVGEVSTDPTDLIEPPKTPKRLPEFVEVGRMDNLLTRYEWPDNFEGRRDRLTIELLYGTGMRLAELLGLAPRDFDPRRKTLRVLGKRKKERIIPIADPLTDLLVAYLKERDGLLPALGLDSALLVKKNGEPMPRRVVQRLVSHYLGAVTPQQKRSPHVLRHTFATHLLNNGADLNAVKELLGHAGLAATQVYTHNTVEKLKKAHQQAHPRGGASTIRTNENG
jgi:integrase/recombinase XerC